MKIKLVKEVYSEKQRRFMCAVSKQGADRPKGLSKAEAEEMCKGPMKEEEQTPESVVAKAEASHVKNVEAQKGKVVSMAQKFTGKNINIDEVLQEIEYDTAKVMPKTSLNRKFWDKNRLLDRKTRKKLLQIAENFIESLGIEEKVKDITMTGSLASYNWHKTSDIDLHILINYEDFDNDKDLLKDFFNLSRSAWNEKHNIMIRGHEVEIYIQDEDEEHHANGVYSIQNDEWIVKPSPVDTEIDVDSAIKKADGLLSDIDHVKHLTNSKKYKNAIEMSDRLKEKIKNMRSTGLERDGIYSVENIAFKLLRNSKQIDKLHHYSTKAYDKMMGIVDIPRDTTIKMVDEEQINEKLMLKPGPNGWDLYSKLVAEAYLAAPKFEQRAVSHFEAMIPFVNKMFKRIESKIEVEFIDDHPYKNVEELRDDVFNNQIMKVSTLDAEHDIFDPVTNAKFRAVHDFMSHIQAIGSRGTDFSLKGEIQSYNTHLKTMPPASWPALFTEIVGQASTYFYQGGQFAEQKIALLDGFDYENIGVVEGYDIVNKELVKKQIDVEIEPEEDKMVAEDFQTDVKKGHKAMKFKLIGLGKGKNTPQTKKPDYKRSKSAPAGAGALEESVKTKKISIKIT